VQPQLDLKDGMRKDQLPNVRVSLASPTEVMLEQKVNNSFITQDSFTVVTRKNRRKEWSCEPLENIDKTKVQ